MTVCRFMRKVAIYQLFKEETLKSSRLVPGIPSSLDHSYTRSRILITAITATNNLTVGGTSVTMEVRIGSTYSNKNVVSNVTPIARVIHANSLKQSRSFRNILTRPALINFSWAQPYRIKKKWASAEHHRFSMQPNILRLTHMYFSTPAGKINPKN